MRSLKSLVLLAVLTVVVLAAAIMAQKPSQAIPGAGELLFPGLLGKVNKAVEIDVQSKGKRFTLKQHDHRWGVAERGGYPVAPDKIHKLLVGAAELRRVEPKTDKAKHYPALELADPARSDSKSIEFKVKDGDGKVLADWILGKRSFAKGDPNASEFFVRVPPDARAWLVQGSLPIGKSVTEWIDQRVAAIAHQRIREVKVTRPDGESLVVRRLSATAADYTLADIPAGMEVSESWKVGDVGRFLEDLRCDDVEPIADASFVDADRQPRLELTTYDGLRVVMETTKDGKRTLARLRASFDPKLVEKPAKTAAPAEDTKAAKKKTKAGDALGVKQSVADLNRRWRDWAFVLPDYKVGYLLTKRGDLLKSKTAKKDSGGG